MYRKALPCCAIGLQQKTSKSPNQEENEKQRRRLRRWHHNEDGVDDGNITGERGQSQAKFSNIYYDYRLSAFSLYTSPQPYQRQNKFSVAVSILSHLIIRYRQYAKIIGFCFHFPLSLTHAHKHKHKCRVFDTKPGAVVENY